MKTLKSVFTFCLLLSILLAVFAPAVVWAQEPPPEETPPEEKIEVVPTYPRMEAIAGGTFQFEVGLTYSGTLAGRDFDLQVTGPKNWDVYMTPQYENDKKISAIRLQQYPGNIKIRLVATAPFFPLPDPGQYKIKLEAVSGQVKGSGELTAVITAKYILSTAPALEGRYNTTAQAGSDNFFSINVSNLGSAPIDNIKFSSTKPEGWTVEFKPDKIESLGAIDEQTVDVNIKPAPKTIAGDYLITLTASGTQTSAGNMNIRVTVETPSVWGWVGVGIILVVVAGVIGIFMRFSRR